MDKTPAEDAVKQLTLILIYLTRFNEKIMTGIESEKAWKGYDFGVLND